MRRWRAAWWGALCVLAVGAAGVRAAATSPTLVLSHAAGMVAGARRGALVEGAFDYENAVQLSYPLTLVVFQGSRFARYPLSGAAVTGDSTALTDGTLTEDELGAFAADGAPAPPEVRVVTLAEGVLRVVLPATFTAGPATGILYAVLPDGTVLSNPIAFALP